MAKDPLLEEIAALKAARSAVILAHNYVRAEIQDIADFCGDSLELSIRAEKNPAPVFVMCGVRFMAETCKLLSPDSIVLLPRPDAGCPMADMVDPEELAAYKKAHPGVLLVAYVNTTAEVKSMVDICCTSGNAEKVISSIPADREIMFLPDRNLGANLISKLKRPMQLWHGCCPVHDAVTAEDIARARKAAPGAVVLVHPECRPETVAAADHALSTGGMLKYVREASETTFIVGTESGILHRLIRENPGKHFYPLQAELCCSDMKKITLADVASALKNLSPRVELPADLAASAVQAIRRMTAL